MKKIIAVALMAFILTACGGAKQSGAGIPNPFVECATVKEACELAGIELSVPDAMEGYTERTIRAAENKMIEVIYGGGEDELRIRKAAGSGDVSGDYNEYAENSTAETGGIQVFMRGSDQAVHVATWEGGDSAFAVTSSKGMARDKLLALVAEIR